ncbi:MAG: hypothetical protein A3B37_02925 [Candidatus Sungbacteria bacterium RIFCSPLOWO2_01_FULL_59_16]|uniref:Dockerin domain-containing protein n=1 Tax=Candidatus Sungbacteria bacterium RIFCSPLOWO2_01_FULL_59_16 TaxID=1802280 RepID=A0A1G2LBG7_9BACT|nr:MAG: hypothetical protein A3B37_02925 [Candidatus Sungbacteria bacterium RIFCSPLOWO2_01_FULL_59_16]
MKHKKLIAFIAVAGFVATAIFSSLDVGAAKLNKLWVALGDDIHNTNSGNVGIATTMPAATLTVNGSSYVRGGSGDVSEDGSLTSLDAALIAQYLVGTRNLTPAQYAKADVNGDGRVNTLDRDLIANIRVGNVTLDDAHHGVGKFKADTMLSPTYAGNLGIGTTQPQSALHVPDGRYFQAEDNNSGPPPAEDCDSDLERGRLSIDTANGRLYLCNGATRGWDYVLLND